MLSKDDNELIARVGPGTPMGELFRRYWLPALLSNGDQVPTQQAQLTSAHSR